MKFFQLIFSLLFFLGVFDEEAMSEDKTFYTDTIPSKENILSEVLKGAIDGSNLPAQIDRKSLAIERIYAFISSPSFGDRANTRLNSETEFVKAPIYDIMERAYLGILDNFDTRDEHFPDYVSAFQGKILSSVLQTIDYNPKLIRNAPTTFPPYVNPEEVNFVTKTITIDWKYNQGGWFSTKFYAVPGKLFTVTIPEEQIGQIKVIFQFN